jgi:hypothetical protein
MFNYNFQISYPIVLRIDVKSSNILGDATKNPLLIFILTGVPKVLVGNRLHLAFKRQVAAKQAELYAQRHKMVNDTQSVIITILILFLFRLALRYQIIKILISILESHFVN